MQKNAKQAFFLNSNFIYCSCLLKFTQKYKGSTLPSPNLLTICTWIVILSVGSGAYF